MTSNQESRLSFRNVALLVGRISLLKRLAGALGLKAAKYQYAIDQHHRDHKTKSSGASEDLMEGGGEKICLSTGTEGSHYGAVGEERCPAGSQERCDQKQEDTREGCYNRAYQAEELQLK
ncbi:Protein FAM177A1 [Dissostichus eleginoides]|uniref:Protein FAM177A1 n=1 Tax=Dissostichus eleginoides TaxID=100907 RepID=A0AAD9F7U6_DISEL|nr:Protein FAM177A1 [Dissostichus eleginoides]